MKIRYGGHYERERERGREKDYRAIKETHTRETDHD
jgi:hypothetical protein